MPGLDHGDQRGAVVQPAGQLVAATARPVPAGRAARRRTRPARTGPDHAGKPSATPRHGPERGCHTFRRCPYSGACSLSTVRPARPPWQQARTVPPPRRTLPMTAGPVHVDPPPHPLYALTTYELARYRRELEHALAALPGPRAPAACSSSSWPSPGRAGIPRPDHQPPPGEYVRACAPSGSDRVTGPLPGDLAVRLFRAGTPTSTCTPRRRPRRRAEGHPVLAGRSPERGRPPDQCGSRPAAPCPPGGRSAPPGPAHMTSLPAPGDAARLAGFLRRPPALVRVLGQEARPMARRRRRPGLHPVRRKPGRRHGDRLHHRPQLRVPPAVRGAGPAPRARRGPRATLDTPNGLGCLPSWTRARSGRAGRGASPATRGRRSQPQRLLRT